MHLPFKLQPTVPEASSSGRVPESASESDRFEPKVFGGVGMFSNSQFSKSKFFFTIQDSLKMNNSCNAAENEWEQRMSILQSTVTIITNLNCFSLTVEQFEEDNDPEADLDESSNAAYGGEESQVVFVVV